jgi:hypothetical protein
MPDHQQPYLPESLRKSRHSRHLIVTTRARGIVSANRSASPIPRPSVVRLGARFTVTLAALVAVGALAAAGMLAAGAALAHLP